MLSPSARTNAIAAGYLTDITSIIVTHAAEAGALIDVEVRVKNISTETLAIAVTGLVEGLESGAENPLYYSPDYIWVDPGSTGSFTTTLIMPGEDVRLWVATWYWDGTQFIQDLVVYTDISLIEVPAFRIQIVDIIAPASASAGDVVDVEVKVVNFTSFLSFYVAVNCIYDDTVLTFSPEYIWMVPAYPPVTESFTASFIMPDKDFHGLVASWYWAETEWIRDDFAYLDIALVEVPPEEYYGTITKKQLTYDSVVGSIPVAAKVSTGTRGIVTVLGRNDMDTTQQMGIIWRVKDPDGYVVEHYSAWEAWPYNPPGGEHKFDGGRFDLDKPGVWTIEIALYMNHDDPVIVDSYMGTLCTVEAVEYAGTISKKQFKYDSVIGDIPVTAEVSQGMNGIVTAWGRNDMAVQQQLGMRWEVRDPDGYVVEQYPGGGAINWEYGYTGPGDEQDFIGGRFDLNKLGGYTIFIELFMNPDDPVMVADYDGLLCTVVPAFPEAQFQNFAITGYDGVPVDEQLMVIPGQTATVHMTVDYRGPAIDGAIYIGIGWRVGVVIEQFVHTFTSRTPIHFEASYDFTPLEFDCDVDILTLPPLEEALYGTLLDMYAKIIEVPGPDIYTPFYIGVMAWSKPPEEYELIQHTIHHFAYIYDGDAEINTVTLKTDPFKPADWVPENLVAELEREARESGVRVLETKVYVDTSPLLWTDYKIEVIGTPSGEVTGAAVGALPVIPLWVKIIIGALAAAFLIYVITWAVKTVAGVFKHKVGLEDVKVGWGKEALILDIRDSEEYWERPLTPIETLEGKSEEELRDILDQIAEEEVPVAPPIPWAWIIGGVAVVGVAAVALAARKR